MGPKEPVRNECEVIHEIFHILNCRCENQVSYDPLSYESNSCNCVYGSLQKSVLQQGLNL